MSDIEEEGYIDKSPIPVSIKGTEKIIQQMKKCVCKIVKDNIKGTGFFSKIPYKDELKKVLITNNHILNKNDIKNNKMISISINNEEKYKDIKIDDKRLILIDEIKDVTMIEIKDKDKIENYIESNENIKDINYLELDEKYNKDRINERYKKESIYILHYPKGGNIVVSYGLLNDIEDNYIYHLCSTEDGSSGSPIISLKSFKLIGIHIGNCINKINNKGLFIKYAIDEFNKIENNILIIENKKLIIENNKINQINQMILKYKINEMTIKYKVNKERNQMRLFGDEFVKNNKNRCKIVIEGKEKEITENMDIDEKIRNKDILEIKLQETNLITDMSYIFSYSENLSSSSDISKWDTKNVNNMSGMFSRCNSLKSLPDISNWDTKNVTDMSYMFDRCNSLESLSNISNWNTSNVTNMSSMFSGCNSLKSLPDISNWDIQNVTDMNSMFNGCKKLPLSDIPNKFEK